MIDSMTLRCPDLAAKQAHIITPPPPCLAGGMRFLCYAVFVLLPNVTLCIIAKHRQFALVCKKGSLVAV